MESNFPIEDLVPNYYNYNYNNTINKDRTTIVLYKVALISMVLAINTTLIYKQGQLLPTLNIIKELQVYPNLLTIRKPRLSKIKGKYKEAL